MFFVFTAEEPGIRSKAVFFSVVLLVIVTILIFFRPHLIFPFSKGDLERLQTGGTCFEPAAKFYCDVFR